MAPPGRKGAAGPSAGTATLFQVSFRHGYYNALDGRCPDFSVVPTPDCAALMGRLGLGFRDTGTGFLVQVPAARLPALAGYLASRFGDGPDGQGYWTRLSFQLVLRNPAFFDVTALPLDTTPVGGNFHADNLAVHKHKSVTGQGTQFIFGGQGGAAPAIYPLTGPSLAIPVSKAASVSVCDLSGAAVATATVPAGTATVSLCGRAYGLYTISVSPASAYAGPAAVLYVPGRPVAAGLLELLLAQPTPGTGQRAAFPIGPLPFPPTAPQPPATVPSRTVPLVLEFEARRTTWQYYVVSQDGRGAFGDDLSITGEGATFQRSPEPVTLPDGQSAVLFASSSPLPLRQHSPYKLRLRGQRRGPAGSRDPVAVDRLPVAPAFPVWPSEGDPSSGRSEIFVYV